MLASPPGRLQTPRSAASEGERGKMAVVGKRARQARQWQWERLSGEGGGGADGEGAALAADVHCEVR